MVDAVNNNRDAVYTGIGAGVGAVAGGAYGGWLSKPLLSKDAPSDAFVRRYYDNSAKDAAEAAKKAFIESDAYKNAGEDVAKLTDIVKADPKKFGVKAEEGKTIDDAVKAFVGEEPKAADLKSKMEKAVAENTNVDKKSGKELTKLKKAFEKLGDNPDENAVKDFVKKHAEILGEKADGTSTIATKEALKNKVDDVIKPLEEAKGKILEHFDVKEGMKKLADNADESTKSAFEAVKKAARDTKLWAGAKWAAIGAAVIGVCSYIGAKMTAPKAEAPAEENV